VANTFGCVPAGAFSDVRLTAVDLRVLGAVCMLDGRSLSGGKGKGCYASRQTIAGKVGCSKVSAVASIKKLIALGYVVADPSQHHRQQHILRVIYEGEMVSGTGQVPLPGLASPTGQAPLSGSDATTGKIPAGNRISPATKPVKSPTDKALKTNEDCDPTRSTRDTRAMRPGFLDSQRVASDEEPLVTPEQIAELRLGLVKQASSDE